MAKMYSKEYYEYIDYIGTFESKLGDHESQLKDLDSDYSTIHECKLKLAQCSILLNEMINQCGDINKVFDRKTIEGEYDLYHIDFNRKDMIFTFLEEITSSTDFFNTSCDNIKRKIDLYGQNLDDKCKEIANKAENLSNEIDKLSEKIRELKAQIIYKFEPE